VTSIRRWLLGWLICGLACACAIAGYSIFHTARAEAGELFDYELRTVALSLPINLGSAKSAQEASHDFKGIADDRIVIDIWNAAGVLVYRSAEQRPLPRFPAGIRSVERGDFQWRVFGLQQPSRFIQVAQPFSVREDLALRLASRTLWPLAILMPVTIMLVLLVVARGLAPINGLSRSLATRSIGSLEPILADGAVPIELRPLVEALDDLLRRLKSASQAQHTFLADAAHELRSPLTALKLQFQASVRDGTLSGEPGSLGRLEDRLNRTIHLAQQLLTMAREDASPGSIGSAGSVISLRRLAERAVGDFSALAEAKGVDVGLEFDPGAAPGDDYMISAEPHSLGALLNNLLDNAIRHTPAGGKVDVVLRRGPRSAGFDVLDTGPGIPDAEIGRVADRFYRGEAAQGQGAGLGLAIARRIVERHGAALGIENREGGGLRVSVRDLPALDGALAPAAAR
jgi:two-component system OmpR family sensor kinase